jgi:hypothetical protein
MDADFIDVVKGFYVFFNIAEAGEWDIIGKIVARLKVGNLFQLK